jgi:hypothetical protein
LYKRSFTASGGETLYGVCVKSLSPPQAAEYSFVSHIIFMISRSEIMKMMWLTKHNSALRAKFKFETDVFFMILRSKIMKNTSVSKEYSAAVGGKIRFTQSQIKSFAAKPQRHLKNSCKN